VGLELYKQSNCKMIMISKVDLPVPTVPVTDAVNR